MNELRGRHVGETATIVGCGLSVLNLTAADFSPGPVLTLNHAILAVRALRLPNLVYSMQKDGCQVHGADAPIPLACHCPSPEMVPPEEPEELILSWAESSFCFADYPRRHIVDVANDLGLSWCISSAPVAVKIVAAMGCTAIRMLAHDAYIAGITDRAFGEPSEIARSGYVVSGREAQSRVDELGLPVEWVPYR